MMCRCNIPYCFWLFVIFSIGEFYSPASAGSYDDLDDCLKVHFEKPTCPKYDESLQCLNKVKVDSDFVAMTKTFMTKHLKEQKNASCSVLTSRGTCMRIEYPKCTGKFIDLRAENHPDVCMEASKTLACLRRLTDACPHSVAAHIGSISVQEVEMSIKDCSEGFHEGSCAPRHVDSCVEFAWEKAPEGHVIDFVARCYRAKVDAAKSCLGKIKSSCTSRQLDYHDLIYDELVACPFID